jgi:hypothetical protein
MEKDAKDLTAQDHHPIGLSSFSYEEYIVSCGVED